MTFGSTDPDPELERYRAENLELRRQVSEHKKRADELLASSSWRWTAPLRAFSTWIAKFTGRGDARGGEDSISFDQYQSWLRAQGTIDGPTRDAMLAGLSAWPVRTRISVVMPVYNTDVRWLETAIRSIREQIYPHFELCISDDASTVKGLREFLQAQAAQDARIRLNFRETNGHISVNSNSALTLATGDYVALFDADDLLPPDALYWVACAIASHPDADLLFSDEDKIGEDGVHFDPYFKGAWNPALMLSQNAFSHLGVFRHSLVKKVGGFRGGFEGAQDHDLVLRCAEQTTADRIRHIPRILYHWRALPGSTATSGRAKAYAWDAGRRAIEQHLVRKGIAATVEPALSGYYQVSYAPPPTPPLVSIVVVPRALTERDLPDVASLLRNTAYSNIEVIVATAREASSRDIPGGADVRVRVAVGAAARSQAALVSFAAAEARGELLCLMNDDVEPATSDWLDTLVSRASLAGVGAVAPLITTLSGTIVHAGMIHANSGAPRYPFRGLKHGAAGYFGRAALEQDCSCISSDCMLIRRDAFEDGLGHTSGETLFEAVDFCQRLRLAGYRILYVPAARMLCADGARDEASRHTSWARDGSAGATHNDPFYNPNLSLDQDRIFQLDENLPRAEGDMRLALADISRSSAAPDSNDL